MVDLALALHAAEAAYPQFGWHTTRSPISDPSGYRLDIVDDNTATAWIDGTLDLTSGHLALIDAIDELLGTVGNVVPLWRTATTFEALDGRAVEGLGS